jgi:hypothetical protein
LLFARGGRQCRYAEARLRQQRDGGGMSKDITPELRRVGVLPPSGAEQAADRVSKADLVALFETLHQANKLAGDPAIGAWRATIAAVEAAEKLTQHSLFTRLRMALINSPPTVPGSILPGGDGKAVETENRELVDYLKACGAYATVLLSRKNYPLKKAAADVAMVFLSHNFPRAHYFEKNGKPKKKPTLSTTSKYLEELSREYRKNRTNRRKRSAVKGVTIRSAYNELIQRLPLGDLNAQREEGLDFDDARYAILFWLGNELDTRGYPAGRASLFY